MKDEQKILNLVAVELDSELARKAVSLGFTLTRLRRASKSELAQYFEDEEVDAIWKAAKRQAIPGETLHRLIEECDWKCCECWDYRKASPVVIHHIEEHSKTRDDSYDNLVVLCLNHHALAHSRWDISRHPLLPDLLRTKKRDWKQALVEFKAGNRPAPGYEASSDTSDYVSMSQGKMDKLVTHQQGNEIVELERQQLREMAEIKALLLRQTPSDESQSVQPSPACLSTRAQHQSVIAQCQVNLDQNPSDWKAWLSQAVAFYELGSLDEALIAMNRTWELNNHELLVISVRGCILTEYAIARDGSRSMLTEAIGLFESLRLKIANPSVLDYNTGNAYGGLNEHQKAVEHFDRALAENPERGLAAQIWKNRGTCYYHLGDYEEEIRSYQKALQLDPSLFAAYASWGATELRRKDYQRARALLEQAFEVNPEREVGSYAQLYSLAYSLWRLGDSEEAYRRVKQVLAIRPTHQDGLKLRAFLLSQLWRERPEYVREAIACYENRILDDPSDTAARNELFLIYRSDEHHHDARSVLEQTALSPYPPLQSLYHYAMVLENEGAPEDAEQYLETAYERSKEHHIVHSLARLKKKTEDYRGAIELYERALQDVEDPIPILRSIADCYHFLTEHKECVRILARAVQIDPRDAELWANLDYALTQLGQEDLFSAFASFLHRLGKGDGVADVETEAAVSELLSRLAVQFGDEFVLSIRAVHGACS